MANMLQWTEEQKEQVGLIRRALSNRSIEDRSSGWVSGLWTPTIERPRSRLSEDVPRPIIRISEDEAPKEVNELFLLKKKIYCFYFKLIFFFNLYIYIIQSFSDMWISFLLKEVSKDKDNQPNSNSDNNSSNSKQE